MEVAELVSLWSLLDILRFLGGGVCHQIPDRSLLAGGTPLPLCARDTGTYLGLLLGVAAIVGLGRVRAGRAASWPLLGALGAFFLAWAGDGLNSYLVLLGMPHLYEPQNWLRLLTGTLQGLALILAIWPVAALTFWRLPEERRVIEARELAGLVAVALQATGLLSLPQAAPRLVAGLLSGLALVGVFTLLNAMLGAVAFRREGSADKPEQVLRLLALALPPALLELTVLSLLRHWLLGF